MSINVTGPDGRVHTFPDGTAAAEIERTMRRQYGATPSHAQARASAAQASRETRGITRRSLWERFIDNASDVWNTSALVETYRAGRLEGAQNAAGELSFEETKARDGLLGRVGITNPVRSYGRFVGALGEAIQPGTTLADARADVTGERARRSELARVNDREQGNDSFLSYAREGDLGGAAAHGAVALAGTLAGAAADPVSYLSAGRTVIARAATQAALAGGADAVAQMSGIDVGIQDAYDTGRTALSAAAGGSFSALGDLAGAGLRSMRRRTLGQPEAAVAEDLQVADDLNAPALTTADIEPTPPRGTPEETSGSPLEAPEAPRAVLPPEEAQARSTDSLEASEGIPVSGPTTLDAPTTWESIDWGARQSPERASAAARHLDGLKTWIKSDRVAEFVRAVDEGLPEGTSAKRINERWIDWDRMGDPREVLRFTSAIADIFRSTYDHAGDAKQGWDKTAEVARQMGFTISDIIKTHADVTGEGGIAARAGALRDAALASDKAFHDQLVVVRAAIQKGDKSGVPALVESLNRTVVLGAMDAGASAEIARALQYRQRKPDFAHSDLQAAMDEIGRVLNKGEPLDDVALTKIVDQLSDAYERGGSAALRQRIGQIREMGFWDYVGYYATANLLAAPTTHIRNATGTPIHALFQIGERYTAAAIGAARTAAGLGSKERVTFREALAYAVGTTQAFTEALHLARAAFRRGAPVSDLRSSVMANETAAQVPFAFSAARLAEWRANPLSPATIGDALGVAVFEMVRTLGFRASVATDEFYKALGRRAQINALSYREAAYRSALAGPERADEVFTTTLKALQEQPTTAAFREAREFFQGGRRGPQGVYEPGSREEEMALIMRSIDHRQMAVDHAQLLTFQDSGPVVDKLDAALRAVPLVKHLWVNFVRTPASLLKAGLVARNPLVGGPVAALELTTRSGWEKHKALFDALISEEQALERGGAEADLVLARQIVGSAVLGTFWMLWAGGNVVGKQSQEERRSGVQDYSVRLPDGTWVQYSGLSPIAEMLGLVADTGKTLRDHDVEDDGAAAIMGALAAAVRNNVVNKSFLKGVSDFMEMMTGGSYGATTDEASGETIGRQLGEALAPRIVPGGALWRRIAQDQDPVIRDVRSFTDMILAGVPTMTDSIAARRDFLGRPLVRPAGQRGAFQAFNTSTPSADPLERELAGLASALPEGFRIGMTPRKMNGEDLTPTEYSRLVEVQGQLFRIRGRNLEESLRDLIATEGYRSDPPEARAYQVKRTIERFREGANAAVRNPRSDLFMREAATRTGAVRLRQETVRRGWSPAEARRNARRYGLEPTAEDADTQMLREALDAVGE